MDGGGQAEGGRNPRTDLKVGHYKSGRAAHRLQKSPWTEDAMSEEGHEENRQKDRHQDL
jgi:hypothetical protein